MLKWPWKKKPNLMVEAVLEYLRDEPGEWEVLNTSFAHRKRGINLWARDYGGEGKYFSVTISPDEIGRVHSPEDVARIWEALRKLMVFKWIRAGEKGERNGSR